MPPSREHLTPRLEMLPETRFSPTVIALRNRAAVRPLEGVLSDARALLAQIEGAHHPQPPQQCDIAALLILIGSGLTSTGEYAGAVSHHTRAHDIAVSIGDRQLEGEAAAGIGAALLAADDHGAALGHFERAERIAMECGNDRLRATLLRRMGASCSILGRHAQAMDLLGEAAAVLSTLPAGEAMLERLHLANSTLNAKSREVDSLVKTDPRRISANEALLPQWLKLADDARVAGMEHLEIMALGNYAIDARRAGQHAEAIRVLRALVPRYEAKGMRPNVAIAWNHLGYALEETGEFEEAKAAFERALMSLDGGGSVRERRDAYEGLGRAAERLNDPWGALAAIKAARALDSTREDEEARTLAAQRQHRIELKQLTERWERLAEQDPLTGLNNRRALEAWVDARALDRRSGFALMMIDLDDLKPINDRFGHPVGDRVLVEIGRLLRAGCRAQDIAARIGGDEFVLASPGADLAEAQAIAERVRVGIASHRWQAIAPGLAVTCSVGCASSAESADPGAVLALADQRLYEAKRGGRNRIASGDARISRA